MEKAYGILRNRNLCHPKFALFLIRLTPNHSPWLQGHAKLTTHCRGLRIRRKPALEEFFLQPVDKSPLPKGGKGS
eukprot:934968-Amphidinium_carterae.1